MATTSKREFRVLAPIAYRPDGRGDEVRRRAGTVDDLTTDAARFLERIGAIEPIHEPAESGTTTIKKES